MSLINFPSNVTDCVLWACLSYRIFNFWSLNERSGSAYFPYKWRLGFTLCSHLALSFKSGLSQRRRNAWIIYRSTLKDFHKPFFIYILPCLMSFFCLRLSYEVIGVIRVTSNCEGFWDLGLSALLIFMLTVIFSLLPPCIWATQLWEFNSYLKAFFPRNLHHH